MEPTTRRCSGAWAVKDSRVMVNSFPDNFEADQTYVLRSAGGDGGDFWGPPFVMGQVVNSQFGRQKKA